MDKSSIFSRSLLLTAGRLVCMIVGLMIPIYVSRQVSVIDFGAYKLVFTIYYSALMLLDFGMDQGFYFFTNDNKQDARSVSFNALMIKFIGALPFAGAAYLWRTELGALTGFPGFEQLVPYIVGIVVLACPTSHLEHQLISANKIKQAAAVFITDALVLSLGILIGYFFYASLEVGLGIILGYNVVKFTIMLIWNMPRQFQRWSFHWQMAKSQLAYCLPLGATNFVALLISFDRYVVLFATSPEEFTIYVVGCFDLPLLPFFVRTIHDLVSLEIVELRKKGIRDNLDEVWTKALRLVIMIVVPAAVFLILFAPEFMTLIYTDKYLESAKYFQLYLLAFVALALDPEAILRAFSRTKLVFTIQGLMSIATFLSFLGLALAVNVYVAFLSRLFWEVVTIYLKAQFASGSLAVDARQLFPFGGLVIQTLLAGAVAYAAKVGLGQWLDLSGPVGFVAALLSFTTVYLGLAFLMRQITVDDIREMTPLLGAKP